MEERVWDITTREDLEEVAREVLNEPPATDYATVLSLHGDLGAGKTTFVQTLAKQLGVKESVNSQTFVIMKKYDIKHSSWATLVHIDAYRLDSEEELKVLDFERELTKPGNLICIEWAEKVKSLLPSDARQLFFELSGEQRSLRLE